MNVAALLDFKGHEVTTIHQDRSIAEAVALLREHRIGALVVTGTSGPLVGILSERDVVNALAARGVEIVNDDVATLMSRDIQTCTPDTTCDVLMGMMTEHRIRHLPVLSRNRLVGLISIGDVVRARLVELERDRQDLLDYVSAR